MLLCQQSIDNQWVVWLCFCFLLLTTCVLTIRWQTIGLSRQSTDYLDNQQWFLGVLIFIFISKKCQYCTPWLYFWMAPKKRTTQQRYFGKWGRIQQNYFMKLEWNFIHIIHNQRKLLSYILKKVTLFYLKSNIKHKKQGRELILFHPSASTRSYPYFSTTFTAQGKVWVFTS